MLCFTFTPKFYFPEKIESSFRKQWQRHGDREVSMYADDIHVDGEIYIEQRVLNTHTHTLWVRPCKQSKGANMTPTFYNN